MLSLEEEGCSGQRREIPSQAYYPLSGDHRILTSHRKRDQADQKCLGGNLTSEPA
jgi:hypothetical protein